MVTSGTAARCGTQFTHIDEWKFIVKTLVLVASLATCLSLQGCVGYVVGTAVDVAVEVAKVPFKVGKAAIDVATGGDKEKQDDKKDDGK
jgi:hypothetical protein